MHQQIVILGCGLSGMFTALALAKYNIKSIIIESKSIDDPKFFSDNRTTALTASSKKFLADIGLWLAIQEIASDILDIYVVDNKASGMLHFSKVDAGLNKSAVPIGHIVKNSELKKLLLAEICKKTDFINLIDQCEYQQIESKDDLCTILLSNNQRIDCSLLIVCNGYNSKVKQQYFIDKISKYYGQVALTFNVCHDKAHAGTAVEHFMPSGPFAILPLKDQNSSSIVWTVGEDQATALTLRPLEEFTYLVQKNFGSFLGKIRVDSEIATFPLKAYVTANYFYQRIVLVADSAHIVHPLAGQGLNQGIKDIDYLTKLISFKGVSQRILKEYAQGRQSDNMAMYIITDNLNRIFSNHYHGLKQLRQIAFKIIDNLPPVKKLLVQYAMGKRW